MSKKKKKIKQRIEEMDPMFDQQVNLKVASALERYVELISSLIIVQGRSKQLIDDSKDACKKACKNLREGKPEKVFDEERYRLFTEIEDSQGYYTGYHTGDDLDE